VEFIVFLHQCCKPKFNTKIQKAMKTLIFYLSLTILSIEIFAQSGAIHGKVFDSDGQALYSANVRLNSGGNIIGTTADFDGHFKIKPLDAGTYTVEVSFIGYQTKQINGVKVYNNQITFLQDIVLKDSAEVLKQVDIIAYKNKLIDVDAPSKMTIPTELLIKSPGTKNPVMIARDYNSDIQVSNNMMIVRGARPGSSSVYIDGVKSKDETSTIPSLAIGSFEIYTGGIPAKYGDVTGGVIMMTTKGYFDILNERKAQESRNK
jgi:hypothetical protein